MFNKEFLLDLLSLQQGLESIVTEKNGVTLADVCNAPMSPQNPSCNIQNVWSYWQDDPVISKVTYQIVFKQNLSVLTRIIFLLLLSTTRKNHYGLYIGIKARVKHTLYDQNYSMKLLIAQR